MTAARRARPAPGWTGGNDSDPGISLLQLLVYALVFGGALALVRWRGRRRSGTHGPDDVPARS